MKKFNMMLKKLIFFPILIIVCFIHGYFAEERSRESAYPYVSKAISSFGFNLLIDLYSAKPSSNENLWISPANIFHALGVLHLGANGNTLKEISKVLGIPPDYNISKEEVHYTLKGFYEKIVTSDTDYAIVKIADALFVQNGFKIKEGYYESLKKNYDALVENVDFTQKKLASQKINGWLAEKTKNRITHILDENSISDTVAMIVSTLYFNGRWAETFPEFQTKTDTFFTGNEKMKVQMMNILEVFSYVKNDEHKFESINLDYDSSDYSLNIILPQEGQTIKDFLPLLKDYNISKVMEKSLRTYVQLKLPKVKFSKSVSLIEPLSHLGLHDVFSNANLSDISDDKLKVSEIIHSSELEINEKGTVATAATAMKMVLVSLPIPPSNPIHLNVNRPFIVNIYNRENLTILFSGIVHRPTEV